MLTHANIVTNIVATMEVFPFGPEDTGLSLLPLAHVFERVLEYCYLYCGVTIAYAESFEAVSRNVIEVQPTLMAVVPRYFEKFHATVMEKVRGAPALRRCLFRWALRVGRSCVPYRLEERPLPPLLALRARWAHRLVLHRLHERVGGRLRFFVTGSAPLSARLGEFFWAVGLPVFEGYGLTETSPVVTANRPGQARLGTVGRVIPGVNVRLAEDGEILVSGPNVMQGYYRNEEANREVFQNEWLRTGDIGELDQDGFLRITDRKKDLFKTSGGKYVAPQPLEGALKLNPYIANAVVIGDRRKFVSALLVPDFENLERFCREGGLGDLALEDQLEHSQVVELYRRQVEAAMEPWPRYERVKEFRLLPRDFSQEEDELTPTEKIKRKVVERKWEALILSMYPD
jgi:long-chain acyl-CoA synthetase